MDVGDLNKYACQLEDSLTQTQQVNERMFVEIQSLRELATNPDLLASYVNDLFTHVYPTQSQQQQVERPQFPDMPNGQSAQQFDLGAVRPDQLWQMTDQLDRAGYFKQKPLVME